MTEQPPHSEDAFVLPEGWSAIVMSPEGETQLVVPNWGGDEEISKPVLALTMASIKFMQDQEWVEELAQELINSQQ